METKNKDQIILEKENKIDKNRNLINQLLGCSLPIDEMAEKIKELSKTNERLIKEINELEE